jgi:hypothetical protein
VNYRDLDEIQVIFGAHRGTNQTILTIHCELLEIIMKSNYDYDVPVPIIVRQILNKILNRELKESIKDEIISLLNE